LEFHGGHGVGRAMHEDPFVPNEGRAGRGYRLRPGLVIAIEPMLISGGTDGYVTDRDGWTLRTASGARAAHSEHTIAVTEQGPVVLTAL
ncbi:MAG: M24 family metallopeptidase, partial [Acidimicrobiales bacterium]